MIRLRDISMAIRGGPKLWADIVRSTCELAIANQKLRRSRPSDLRLLAGAQHRTEPAALSTKQTAILERIAYIIPAMGSRVPWKSDCLVQALAAHRWLARAGIVSDVCIGARNDQSGFEAHAWLRVGERIVTGGDISSYSEFLRDPSQLVSTNQ